MSIRPGRTSRSATRARRVVDRVSLEVHDGELFVLLGASGSGKSTVLRLISGLLAAGRGHRSMLGGRDVTALAAAEAGRRLRLPELLDLPAHDRRARTSSSACASAACRRAERRDAGARSCSTSSASAGLGARYESQLSGGQLQRVALARALAYEPAVLLLDEPFGALDVKIRVQLRQNLKQIQQTLGVTTILVTHDQEEGVRARDSASASSTADACSKSDEPEDLYTRPRLPLRRHVSRRRDDPRGPLPRRDGSSSDRSRCRSRGRAPRRGGPRPRPLPAGAGEASRRPSRRPARRSLGRGELIEENFAGGPGAACALRLPPLAGDATALARLCPFGEDALLIDASVPADGRPVARSSPGCVLEHWHILRQPTPRLLVCDAGRRARVSALAITPPLLAALDGVATVARRRGGLRRSGRAAGDARPPRAARRDCEVRGRAHAHR